MPRRLLFSLTCVAVLAFGLGTATAVFSVLYEAVLRPLPFPDPDRLVAVHNKFPGLHLERLGGSAPDYVDLQKHRELFDGIGAYYFQDFSRTGIARPEKVNAVAATASLFQVLGAAPRMGRLFTPEEEQWHGPHAVILSEAYWRRGFQGDPDILGRTMMLNREPYSIVGVMPASFQFPNDVTQMWTPVTFNPKVFEGKGRQSHWLRMYARLAPGLPYAQAEQRMDGLSRQMSLEHPEDYPYDRLGWRFFVLPMNRDDDGSLRRWVYILFAAVLCLLAIVCSNVAGLLLVRATERKFEFSIRRALGASPARLTREVFSEVVKLTLLGGAGAVWIAAVAIRYLALYKQFGHVSLNGPVLLFLAIAMIVTAFACGAYPALAARRSVAGVPNDAKVTVSRGQRRSRQVLITGQVALATALLISGGLLLRSLTRLLATPPGFDAHGVLTMQVSLPRTQYANASAWSQFYQPLIERIAAAPGVKSAAACTLLPFGFGENANTFEIVGSPKPRVEPYANLNNVLPGFFETMHIPLIRGRNFEPGEPQPVTVIDQTMADRYFPGRDPIGQYIQMPWDKPFQIIGIAGPIKTSGLDVETRPTLYFSALQYPSSDMSIVVRSELPEESVAAAVREFVSHIDPDQPIYDVEPLESRIARSLSTRRLVMALVEAFAAAGMILAAIGLYGLLSYTLTLRQREIGIRKVLGASGREIGWLVAQDGFRMISAGLVLGSLGALAGRKFLVSQMYGVQMGDSGTWIAVFAVVVVAGVLATALPAWRALRLDPAACLRQE